MKYTAVLIACLVLLCVGTSRAQNPQDKTPPQTEEERLVINTSLVQVDAVVTDKNGKPVTNLQPEDFELSESGKVRDVKAFSYVDLTSNSAAVTKANKPSRSSDMTPP